MSKVDTFEFPSVDIYAIDDILKTYIGNQCAINYDEHEDITTIQKENNNKEVMVWDTWYTDKEASALKSAIKILSEKVENEFCETDSDYDEEQKELYEQTLKHLCRLYTRNSEQDGRYLR